jgi:transcriptional regulator with XRE-family HTH domain
MFEFLQTSMKNKSTFFDRLMYYANNQGYKNPNELAEALKYKSPEKIYRLQRDENASPSYSILLDISNLFENIDMRWLLTGKSDYTPNDNPSISVFSEPKEHPSPYAKKPKVTPTHTKNVTPTVTPIHENCKICEEKERLIAGQQEIIQALRETIDLLRLRVRDLEDHLPDKGKKAG